MLRVLAGRTSGDGMSDNICAVAICDRPADDGFVCRACIHTFEQVLAETPWLVDELDLVVSRQTQYTNPYLPKASSSDIPLPINLKASDVISDIWAKLSSWVKLLLEENPGWRPPAGSIEIPSPPRILAAWLQSRLDAIRCHEAGAELVEEISSATAAGRYVVDRPASRQFLGKCAEQAHGLDGELDCEGSVYGRPGRVMAACDTCEEEWVAEDLRAYLVGQLEDRICTASEIAHLSTYLGLDIDREQVRKRVNLWASRGRLEKRGNGFRFGDAMILLERHNTTRLARTAVGSAK